MQKRTNSTPHPIPEGYHTATPGLIVKDAAAALAFYQRALGAKETVRMTGPDGKSIIHAEMRIGDSVIFVGEETPEMSSKSPLTLGGATGGIFLYVPDVDRIFSQALAAGATARNPPSDMFWGDRYAQVADPFGHTWSLATHKEDVPESEMRKRADAFYQAMSARGNP